MATVTDERDLAPEAILAGDMIVYRVDSGTGAEVYLEVTLPPGFPEERRLGVIRYARAAAIAVAEKTRSQE